MVSSPTRPHGFRTGWPVTAIPAAQADDNPSQGLKRVRIFLPFGLARQACANRFGRRQQAGSIAALDGGHDPIQQQRPVISPPRVPEIAERTASFHRDIPSSLNGTKESSFAPLECWRHVEVTDRRTANDDAQMRKDFSDKRVPYARRSRWSRILRTRTRRPHCMRRFRPPRRAGWSRGASGTTRPRKTQTT